MLATGWTVCCPPLPNDGLWNTGSHVSLFIGSNRVDNKISDPKNKQTFPYSIFHAQNCHGCDVLWVQMFILRGVSCILKIVTKIWRKLRFQFFPQLQPAKYKSFFQFLPVTDTSYKRRRFISPFDTVLIRRWRSLEQYTSNDFFRTVRKPFVLL